MVCHDLGGRSKRPGIAKFERGCLSIHFVQTNVFRHLVFYVFFDRLLVHTNGGDEVAAGPEVSSGKIPLASFEISCDRDRTFPFDSTEDTEYFGGMDVTICT